MERQKFLEDQIIKWNESYRNGNPLVSDETYDDVLLNCRMSFPDSKVFKKAVIETVKESRKQKLPLQMYSLNKAKSVEEIKQWLKSNNISETEILIITPKYDGISLVVNEPGLNAWTRGDGEVGQQSGGHFRKIKGEVDYIPGVLFSFGEAIMSKENFKKYSDKYANPRNMVAGLFNRDEAGEELKDVDYIRYGGDASYLDKINQIGKLNSINRVECKYLILKAKEFFQHDSDFLEESLSVLFKDWSKDYQIDGLVVDINSSELRNQLGREENLNPKYARAIKLPKWSQSATVKVTGVTWQVSKQGKLKPVIQIEPTELAGVTISNVTGYNAAYVIDNNIAIDSIIEITRSGDVIPKHLSTISFSKSDVSGMIDEVCLCPCCEQPTKWDETMTELICTNPDCEEKQIMKLVHFFNVLEVEDFGEPSIRRFYRAGYKTANQILNISIKEICEIEGWSKKSASKLFDQFDKLALVGVDVAKQMHAMDLTEGKIGEKTIQLILDNISNEKLPFILSQVTIEELKQINGVSDITAKAFLDGYKKFVESHFIRIRRFKTPKQEVVGNKWKDAKICFTGCRPTKEQQSEIESQGGELVSGVSSKTTHLIVKDINSSSSKMVKAKELRIIIIQLNQL